MRERIAEIRAEQRHDFPYHTDHEEASSLYYDSLDYHPDEVHSQWH